MLKPYEQVGVAITSRGFDEYVKMFDLSEQELSAGETLDIAAGGASFTADMNVRGFKATAVDPRYAKDRRGLIEEAAEEIEVSTAKIARLQDQFDWSYYGSLERHREGRIASLQRFAEHIAGSGSDCYAAGSLPQLPFEDGRFSLVLCSHFLFLYEDQFDYDFHLRSVLAMMRVCRPGGTVKIYPVRSLKYESYTHLERLIDDIRVRGGNPELFRSFLPFIPGSVNGLEIKL